MERPSRILMISTHGYVAARPELGCPDTGGQVMYILEVSKCLARMGYEVDILTRQFENQPSFEELCDGVKILRFPCGGSSFIPKESLCDVIPEWCRNVRQLGCYRSDEIALISTHYWDAGLAGMYLAEHFGVPHMHTPRSLGGWKRASMP